MKECRKQNFLFCSREAIESDVEIMRKMEEVAIATGLRNVLLPRLQGSEDRSLVATFVVDLWPDAEVDFGLDEETEVQAEVRICADLSCYFGMNPILCLYEYVEHISKQ